MKKCKWLGILIVAMYIIFATSEVYATSDDEEDLTGGSYDLTGYDLSEIDEIMSGTDYESESFSHMVGRLMNGDSE